MALRYTSSFDQSIGFSDTEEQLTLATNTALAVTLPGNNTQKFILTFGCSSNANIFIGYGVTPTIASAGTATQQPFVEFVVPGMQRYAVGGTVLSAITPDAAAWLGISIRSIPN